MSNKFIDSIKHVIIEDDDPKPEAQAHSQPNSEAAPVAAPVAPPTESSYHPATAQPMSEETEHVYQRILAKTNFNATQVAVTIHKYLDPLSEIPSMDERALQDRGHSGKSSRGTLQGEDSRHLRRPQDRITE